jgi:hypothetical protein
MRIQHVAQAVKGWPGASAKDRQEGARLADIVDQHIRWRLWHGQVQRSLNLIGDTLEPLDAMAKGKHPPPCRRPRWPACFAVSRPTCPVNPI